MGKKKNLQDLKKDLQIIKKKDMSLIVGGKKRRIRTGRSWSTCGGLIPQ